MKQAALTDEGMRRELPGNRSHPKYRQFRERRREVLKVVFEVWKTAAAKRSRECRKDYVRELEERLAGLEQENSSLRAQLGLPPPTRRPASVLPDHPTILPVAIPSLLTRLRHCSMDAPSSVYVVLDGRAGCCF